MAFICYANGLSLAAAAQVFEVAGGTSSLYQSGGGNINVRAQKYELSLGAGTISGHILGGVRVLRPTRNGTYIGGDERIDFRLPTDIFDTSHYLLARGIGFSGVRHDVDVIAFAGAAATDFGSPYFGGVKASTPAAVLFLKKKLSARWQLFSDTVASKTLTQIEALQWTPATKTQVALSAGVGANRPFGAISLNTSRKTFDLQAAYILASQRFRRVTEPSLLLAEPDRDNVLFTWRPAPCLRLTASHQNYLVPQYPSPTNARSSIDQAAVSIRLLATQLNATVYRSSYEEVHLKSVSTHAVAFSATRTFTPRIRLISSYLVSKPQRAAGTSSLIATLTETVTPRVMVSESVTNSNGRTSLTFGGQFLSNMLSLSANYDTYYVPADYTRPFQQALLVDVKFKVLGRLMLHGASFVDPTGHLRYSADASSIYARNQAPEVSEHMAMGRYILHGCVLDGSALPVEGAAILIDEMLVYTDSLGCFSLRENKPRVHSLRVALSEFLVGGNWQVASAPQTITSSPDDGTPAQPVVTVRKLREISSTPPSGSEPTRSDTGIKLP